MQDNARPLKEPLPYARQVEKLRKKHGLIIDDETVAVRVLKHVNYYRLSAYGISLRVPGDKDKYIEGTKFEDLYSLYRFDFRFRHLLLALIESFEIELRSRISFQLSMTYGSEGFRDPSNFLSTTDKEGKLYHTIVMEKLDSAIQDGARKPFVAHHNKEYGGMFPAWVSIELFTFGMLSMLFSIMLPHVRKMVTNVFGLLSIQQFNGWVQAFVDVRNRCAHNERLYNMPLRQPIAMFPDDAKYIIKPLHRIFPVLLALKRVVSDKDLWEWFFYELEQLFMVHPEVDMTCIGFPPNWQDALSPW